MNQNNFLRMQLITQGGNASSFDANVAKIASVVLYDSNSRMTLNEIGGRIKENYDLEFTPEEIDKALKKKNSGIILEVENCHRTLGSLSNDTEIQYYYLDPKLREKYKKNSESSVENDIIQEFITRYQATYTDLSVEGFRELLHRFLYLVFNSNRETLLLLIKNKSYENRIVDDQDNNEFTNNEKRIINDFLNWDNNKKDLFIYQMVSYCVEYCLLTVKKGYTSYKDIFAGKKFYLDTNVIMRLAGVNNEERKTVIQSFIKKCQENKIKIYYTNQTYSEIKETIHSNIQGIKNILNGHRPVDRIHWQNFATSSTNLDFIDLYNEWSNNTENSFSNYDLFEKDLMRTIEAVLRDFKREDFANFSTLNSEEFIGYYDSLFKYKSNRRISVTKKSVETDVNNFMYIRKRRSMKETSFADTQEYFISADGNLCAWGYEIMPGAVPVVVRPSVWYSLLLKFKGRANDDYKAFNLFLNLRYRVNDDKLSNVRERILHDVQNLDEPVELKNLILEDITNRLLSVDDSNIAEIASETIIEKAKESVINRKVTELYNETKNEIIADAQKRAHAETIFQIAENRANKKIKRYRRMLNLFDVIKIIIGILLAVVILLFIYWVGGEFGLYMKKDLIGYNVEGWMGLITFVFAVLEYLICKPIKNLIKKQLDYKRIVSKEEKRLEKDYTAR